MKPARCELLIERLLDFVYTKYGNNSDSFDFTCPIHAAMAHAIDWHVADCQDRIEEIPDEPPEDDGHEIQFT